MTLKQFKRVALLRFGLHGIRSHFARFSPRLPGFLAKYIRHSTAFHPINTETERIFQGRLDTGQIVAAAVVELIRRNNPPGSFAEKLDPIIRSAYGECWDQANDKEYEEPKE